MTKFQLIDTLGNESGLSRTKAKQVVELLFDGMTEGV